MIIDIAATIGYEILVMVVAVLFIFDMYVDRKFRISLGAGLLVSSVIVLLADLGPFIP